MRARRKHVHFYSYYQKLVALTFFRPVVDPDDAEDEKCARKQEKERYYMDVGKLATQYVKHAASLCVECTMARGALNRPNTDRLLELYRHSIPSYGHALFISDINFEAKHQPLK